MQQLDRTLDRARGRWRGILPALGVPEHFLNGRHQPCPICGGKDRARFDDKENRGTFFCSHCGAGSGIDLLMKLHGWDFREAVQRIDQIIGSVKVQVAKPQQTDDQKREAMNKLWRSSRAITATDPAGQYLFARCGIRQFPSCLRAVDAIRYQGDPPIFYPAMIAMVTGPDGKPSILHRTYLTQDGRKAAVEAPRRLMPGTVAKGGAIRLAEPAGELGIAEGIETAFSVSSLFSVPCWAAVSDAMMIAWQPPPEVRRVIVFGDNDPGFAGHAAAYALAKRLVSTKLAVEVRIPDLSGADWNDVHRLAQAKTEAA